MSLAVVLACLAASPLSTSARAVAVELPGEQIDFSARAADDLERFRAALRGVTDEVFARHPATSTAEELQTALLANFAAQGVRPPPPDRGRTTTSKGSPLAVFQGVEVVTPAGQPNLRVVTLHLAVHDCGDDTMLRLYRGDGSALNLVLADHAGRFKNIATGESAVQWAMSAPAPDGSVLMLVASQNPWCQSNWQTLRWRVYRLRKDARSAETIERDSMFAFTQFGEGYQVEASESLVRLTAAVSLDVDPGMTRQRILQWHQGPGDWCETPTEPERRDASRARKRPAGILVGISRDSDDARRSGSAFRPSAFHTSHLGAVERELLAGDALGFLDEWLGSTWSVSTKWTAPEAGEARGWHRRLARVKRLECTAQLVGPCGGGRSWVSLECPSTGRLELVITELRPHAFRLEAIGRRSPEGCRASQSQ